MNERTDRPWYRQLWPWMLMLPPALAVLGGALTLYLAVTHPDALIRHDCVRDGATMRCGADDGTTATTPDAAEERAESTP